MAHMLRTSILFAININLFILLHLTEQIISRLHQTRIILISPFRFRSSYLAVIKHCAFKHIQRSTIIVQRNYIDVRNPNVRSVHLQYIQYSIHNRFTLIASQFVYHRFLRDEVLFVIIIVIFVLCFSMPRNNAIINIIVCNHSMIIIGIVVRDGSLLISCLGLPFLVLLLLLLVMDGVRDGHVECDCLQSNHMLIHRHLLWIQFQ
mmetsp:Transcript_6881/g.11345  ORF Transcript_6881/g.11345 Transcript_6881/m.11345 type:complete len:205 (-) Transcript_6881:741-1355(-)